MSSEQPTHNEVAYEAPKVTSLGSLQELTQYTVGGEHKKFALDVDYVGWFPVILSTSK